MTNLPGRPAKIHCIFFLLLSCLLGSLSPNDLRAAPEMMSSYQLSLSFIPKEGTLIGTSKITIEAGQQLTLYCQEIEITGSLLQNNANKEQGLLPVNDVLNLPPAKTRRILYLSYSKTVAGSFNNLISPDGISLTSNWYPMPKQRMQFTVTATLPDNFTAITESDNFPLQVDNIKQQGNIVKAVFSTPTTSIHFIAGPYRVDSKEVRKGLRVYSMFFKEDQQLAKGYIDAAADYLRRYEQEIGPYPYNHYVIVANRLPTGYGMPTFTLMGQMVLRLPFIKETSLGHEIVHSWFGNGVEVDPSQGNWCEALTTFLADHAYRKEQGEGAAVRLESITRYHSYVHKESVINLASFQSASHSQPMARAKRTVGYQKGALLFHELREKIGRRAFTTGVRNFYQNNLNKEVGWKELQLSFEKSSGQNLEAFFRERLERNYIPELEVKDINLRQSEDGTIVNFTVLQQSEQPFSLVLPIHIKTMAGSEIVTTAINKKEHHISIPVGQRPLEFTIDPEYSILRQFKARELPPVWSRFLGATQPLIILAKESDRLIYQPLLNLMARNFAETKVLIKTSEEVTNGELAEHDLLFLGLDQQASRSLFAMPQHPADGLTLDVRHNPLNPEKVSVLLTSSSQEESKAAASRLSHYGKYSYLEFKKGRIINKKIAPTDSSLHVMLEELPTGGTLSPSNSFEKIVTQLAENRVIYVGETHTSLADHLLQLRIIEALHQKNPKLAIGMEMFPTSSQTALDRYTQSGEESDQRTFLRESDYYNVWRYDYRFFQDIIGYARQHRLPVIGLNLDRKIVSKVFKSGGTDSLSVSEQAALPRDRDLDMIGYGERLSFMHTIHKQGSHGSGAASGFIQAQALWDETMAENIVSFLKNKPDYQMVVLAGSQHTRKDSGIPPRVARRLPVKQATVLNLYNSTPQEDLYLLTDYFFMVPPAELTESPKIGIILKEETVKELTIQKVSQLTPHSKAAAAGLQKDDILQEVNGYPVATMADLRIAMLGNSSGDVIDLKISRLLDGKTKYMDLQVELTTPPASKPHP